jgi:hypothetical protein
MNPKGSWSAKWLHKSNLRIVNLADHIPGFYCVDIAKEEEEADQDEYEDQ